VLAANMRRIILLLFAFMALSTDWVEYAFMQKEDTQAKIKATFLYGFTKYFDWPGNEANFSITILGDNQGLVAEMNKIAATKQVGGKKIVIHNLQHVKEIERTDILFITPDKSALLADAVSKFKGRGTLIITEKQGLAKVGATINFVVEENKQKFELNKSAASKAGLTIGTSLEKLAANVYN
jgi:hypothetical protein